MNPDRFDDILRKYLKNLGPGDELDPQAPLKDLGLNSMRAIDLLFDLEDEFDVQLPDEAMNDTTFANRANLLTTVESVVAGPAGGAR